MPRRTSPQQIQDLSDLNQLSDLVQDKRWGQRSSAKKQRRNRHCEKQLIRNALTHRPATQAGTTAPAAWLEDFRDLAELPADPAAAGPADLAAGQHTGSATPSAWPGPPA